MSLHADKRSFHDESTYTCLVAGATGLVGHALLKLLIHDPLVTKVTVIARRTFTAEGLGSSAQLAKLHMIVTDFEELDLILGDVRADVVYCALGTTIKVAKTREAFRKVDYEYPLALARWAKKAGVSQYAVITAMGAAVNSMFFYSRVKGELQQALEDLELPGLHVLQPSLLLGERDSVRIGEKIGEKLSVALQFLMIGPMRKYRPIRGDDVALAMKRAAEKNLLERRAGGKRQSSEIHYYPSDQIAGLARHMTG